MGKVSAIEWTDATWNPWLGCTKVSPGCKNCYAERIEERFGRDFSKVRRTASKTFQAPLNWQKPRMIFTCSMSDFFHEDADEWREEVWDIIDMTPRHTYQILTKRPERIEECLPKDWGDGWPNVWLGTSVEMQEYMWRATALGDIEARVRFLSCEPLLGDLWLLPQLQWNIGWVIVGGESDPNRPRMMNPTWVRNIQRQCYTEDVPFFFKQWGGRSKVDGVWGGRILDQRTWDEMPQMITTETR